MKWIIKKAFFLSAIVVALISCENTNEPTKSQNELLKIEIALGGGGQVPSPMQVFSIDNELNINYQGVGNTDRIGFYKGQFKQVLWDSLYYKLEEIDFKNLDTTYDHVDDDQTIELFIYHKGGVKHLIAQCTILPNELNEMWYWLKQKVNKTQLHKTSDTLIFETSIIPLYQERIKFSKPEDD